MQDNDEDENEDKSSRMKKSPFQITGELHYSHWSGIMRSKDAAQRRLHSLVRNALPPKATAETKQRSLVCNNASTIVT